MNHVSFWRWGLIGALVLTMVLPGTGLAQPATPVAGANLVAEISPVALYDVLLAASFPDDLLPAGVEPFSTYPWQDSNDRDLAGAIGGVIYASGDPFRSDLPAAITYVVYPGASGADEMFAAALEFGEVTEIEVAGALVPAAVIPDMGDATGVFVMVDNVLVYGLAPHSGEPDVDLATGLTLAGIAFLQQVAGDVSGGGATPVSDGQAGAGSGEAVLLALAAAPFPADEIPFEVGELVTLPSQPSAAEAGTGLIGELLVRDAERIYPYPLVFYRVFVDDDAALAYISGRVSAAGDETVVMELSPPAGIELRYPTTMYATLADWPNVSTTAMVQVGSTVVVGNAPTGMTEVRHRQALALAEIAVRHLEDVAPVAIPAG